MDVRAVVAGGQQVLVRVCWFSEQVRGDVLASDRDGRVKVRDRLSKCIRVQAGLYYILFLDMLDADRSPNAVSVHAGTSQVDFEVDCPLGMSQ